MNFFKGDKDADPEVPIVDADSDFGDFATDGGDAAADAAEPDFIPIQPLEGVADTTLDPNAATSGPMPSSKWYRLDERYTLQEFWAEGVILAGFVVLMMLYTWGYKKNRSRATSWFKAHSPVLAKEFASVGFSPLAVTLEGATKVDEKEALRERSPFEYSTYATGRVNVAFVDIKLELIKRFNPVNAIAEMGLATFFESYDMPEDSMQATLYPFDGREAQIVPEIPGSSELRKVDKSTYDGFVFALVNKDRMKKLRDERFDLSITSTKDHAKLPDWVTTMTENSEITEAILTPELAKAIEKAGDLFDHLIITDQAIVKPTTVEECKPAKRIYLKYRLPSSPSEYANLTPLFNLFLRLPDHLAKAGRFRPQVMAKLKGLRDYHVNELKKVSEAEKAEERALDKDKARKEKRDRELAGLDAKGQKKYLEKEKDREMKKSLKKNSMKG